MAFGAFAVVVVVGLAATTMGGDDAAVEPLSSDPGIEEAALVDETTTTTPVALTLADRVSTFCDGDRKGVPDALAYDGAPGRTHTAFQNLNTNATVDGFTYITGDADRAELVVCADVIPDSARDGQLCDDYDDGLIVQVVEVSYDVRVYAARTGEVVASGQVESTDACPFDVFYYEQDIGADGILRRRQSPHFGRVREIAEPFVFPG